MLDEGEVASIYKGIVEAREVWKDCAHFTASSWYAKPVCKNCAILVYRSGWDPAASSTRWNVVSASHYEFWEGSVELGTIDSSTYD